MPVPLVVSSLLVERSDPGTGKKFRSCLKFLSRVQVILLKNITDEDNLRSIGEKLRQSINEPMQTSAGLLHISCSIGASLYPKHSNTLDSLIKSADIAMFKAKKQGRNIVAVAS